MSNPNIYTVGGTVQAGGGIYIQRQADVDMLAHCQAGNFTYVLTARQLGKSSLMVRTAEQLAAEGVCTAVIDLTELGVQATASEWYLGLILKLAFELAVDRDILTWWAGVSHVGLTQRLVLFFRDIVLPQIQSPIVIFIDEIDTTLNLDFTDDFFAAIRYLYNARALEPEFTRLSFALIGVAMPGDLIDDPKRTPFNIGERVELSDFTLTEARPLAAGLTPMSDHAYETLNWIWQWTSGHPYLTQRLCKAVSGDMRPKWTKKAIAALVRQTFLGEMSRADSNLQFVRDMLTKRAPDQITVLKTYRDIRLGWWPVPNEEQSINQSHLKLSGIVRRDGTVLAVRNNIYRQVFDRHWINDYLLSNWWRDMPKVVKAAAVVTVFLLVAFLVSTLLATRNSLLANERANLAQARYLVAQSVSTLNTQYDLALLLALAAYDVAPTDEVQATVRSELAYNPYLLTYMRGHNAPVNSLAFRPDGRWIASASDDGRILLWDVPSRKLAARPLTDHTHNATALTFNPDGTRMVSAGCATYEAERCLQSEMIVWDMSTQPLPTKRLNAHQGQIWKLSFNISGDRLATLSDLELIIWDTRTWQPVWQSAADDNRFISLDFQPALEAVLVVGMDAGNILVFDAATGLLRHEIPAHQGRIHQVTFSPDGQLLASGGRDGTIKLWDVKTWQPITQLVGHTDQVVSVDFNAGGDLLVSTGLDGLIIVWDAATGVVKAVLSGHRGSAQKTIFNPGRDKTILASDGPDNAVILWDLNGDKTRNVWLSAHQDSVLDVDFNADGTVLASSSADNSIILWDVAGADLIGQIPSAHSQAIRQVAFDPNGRFLASAGHDHKIKLWPISDHLWTPITLEGHNRIVRSLHFSPDGTLLASSDDEGRIILWNVDTGQPMAELTGQDHREIFAVAFSPDGKFLASGSWNGTVQFWDVVSLRPVGEMLSVGITEIWDIAFSPDGDLLAVAGTGEKIVFINVPERRLAFQLLTSHTNRINTLAFSPDGHILASGGADNLVRLWDVTTQKSSGLPLQMHSDQVYGLAFSPDGRLLASSDLAGKILLTTVRYESVEESICMMVARNLTPIEWQQYIGVGYSYHKICPDLP